MAVMLTGRPLKTLLLDRMPSAAACGVAILLAVLLHPFGLQISTWIRDLYPVQEQVQNELADFARLLQTAPYPWLPYVMMAVLPAVCEELAFRGFILSGLRHLGSKRWAIGLAAVFFGMAHGIIQQSLSAAALGTVIGYIAVQTGSLIPVHVVSCDVQRRHVFNGAAAVACPAISAFGHALPREQGRTRFSTTGRS